MLRQSAVFFLAPRANRLLQQLVVSTYHAHHMLRVIGRRRGYDGFDDNRQNQSAVTSSALHPFLFVLSFVRWYGAGDNPQW